MDKIKDFYESRYAKDFVETATKYEKACDFLMGCKKVLDVGRRDGSFLMLLKEKSSINPELYGTIFPKKLLLRLLGKV